MAAKIMVMLFFFFSTIQAANLKPSIKLAIKSSELSVIKDALVSVVADKLKDISLPDFNKSVLIGNIEGKNGKVTIIPFKGSNIKIEFVEGTNDILIKGKDITMNTTMDLETTLFSIISHKNKAYIKAANIDFTIQLQLLQNNTRLQITIKNFIITSSGSNFNIRIEGNIIDSALNFLLQIGKLVFFGPTVNFITSTVQEITEISINKALASYKDDIEVTSDVAIRFLFTSTPVVNHNYMLVPLLVYGHKKGSAVPPKELPSNLPNYRNECNKGLQLFISDYIFKTLLRSGYEQGLLRYYKKIQMIMIDMEIDCRATSLPLLELNGKTSLKGNTECSAIIKSIDLDLSTTLRFTAEITTSMTEYIKKGKLYMQIEGLIIDNLKIISGEGIDEKKLENLLNSLIGDFRKDVNEEIKRNGVLLPMSKYFDLSDIEEVIIKNYIYAFGSLKLR